MPKNVVDRPEFRQWVDRVPDPQWPLMPLTHITKGLIAQDIIRSRAVYPTQCDVFEKEIAYFFYGRPAYRVSGDGAIRQEAACPFCFIFKPNLIRRANRIMAFDTGAHARRLFSQIMLDEMQVDDFTLERDFLRPNKLIAKTFGSQSTYFDGAVRDIPSKNELCSASDFTAATYIDLIKSEGRNEPDDRVCTIEVQFGDPVTIEGNLEYLIVPDTLWSEDHKAPWIVPLNTSGCVIRTYKFLPGRNAEYYSCQIESVMRGIYGYK